MDKMHFSTLPHGNEQQQHHRVAQSGVPPPVPARSRHNSTSSVNSAVYGTLTKAGARYIMNNYYDHSGGSPMPEDPEWCYPTSRQFVIANNLHNVSPNEVHLAQSNVSLNHGGTPCAIYIQNNSVAGSGRQSPYNGSLNRRSPLPPQQLYMTMGPRPSDDSAAVIKQLREKFSGDVLNNREVNCVSPKPVVSEDAGRQHQQPIEHQSEATEQHRRALSYSGTNSFTNRNHENQSPAALGQAVVVAASNNKDCNVINASSNLTPSPPSVSRVQFNYSLQEQGINERTGRDGGDSNLKSAWIHCRLPVLFVLVALFLLFLTLSGALLYFKYSPFFSSLRNALEDEFCDENSCAFGASCYEDGEGRSSCRCPEACSMDKTPVCGSDGNTYLNECLLRQLSCQHQSSVRVRHPGPCDMPDPCADKACLFGSRCVASADGLYATCECPSSCPSYGDSEDSQPVCGSDGKYYRNKCELDREACRVRKNITARFFGKCDPCDEIACPAPQVCQLDEERRPVCRCSEMCSTDFDPVCGSDGKTYSNECVMRQEACRARRELRVIFRGKCSTGTNPCASVTCRGYESCVINKFGIAKCTCAIRCDPVIAPVCGSDGRTYDSHCELTRTACESGRQVTVAYRGTCEGGNVCAQHSCAHGATCTEKNGEAVCECPVCAGAEYDPVCGSDGVSYQNECRLRMEACLINNHHVHVLYPGLCNGCDRKQCDFYSICISDPTTSQARCECPSNCTNEVSLHALPVCGTDGVTYSNECDLRLAACRQQKFIAVASKGHCDLCTKVQCRFGAVCENGICSCPSACPPNKDPVCGSDLKTYGNECELQRTACNTRKPLTVHFYGECAEGLSPQLGTAGGERGLSGTSTSLRGSVTFTNNGDGESENERPKLCEAIRCDFGALCELGEDGFPRCTCQLNCTGVVGSRVCGSDLKLYANDCEMRREGCHRQSELRPRPMELCEETEVRPCHGDEPLKHEDTGEDMDCGSGPRRTNCPAGSYCHRSSSFSKCCPKPKEQTTTKRPVPPPQPKCEDSMHGCCPDGVTPAMGEDHAGCPSVCKCNKLGSIAETCDPFTQECQCRPGVATPKCDRCLPGFWGLSRIAVDGHLGCRECRCSKFGSVRDDCEQMTGRCVCKPGVLGHKCDSCAAGEFLGPYGCTSDPVNIGRTCDEVVCGYGAECEQDGNRAGCICNLQCTETGDIEEVCGSDGFTYESECQVRLQSCRSQKPVWVAHNGPCLDSSESDGTENPLRRWTAVHFTEPGDDEDLSSDSIGSARDANGGESARSNSELWGEGKGGDGYLLGTGLSSVGGGMKKSTRHIPPETKYPDDEAAHKNSNRHPSSTPSTVQMKSYLGEACQSASDCLTAHSTCLAGSCVCREGYYEDSDRLQCKQIHSHLLGDTSCNAGVCDPPATCFSHHNGTHSCLCPLGTAGPHDACAVKEEPFPFFSGRSTIAMGKLAGYHKLSLELEITPYLNYAHGILIFSSQHGNGSGDFVSLALIDGFVEFRYDLGDGPAILRSTRRVMSGSTHHIVAKRFHRDGLLRLQGDEEVKGTSPGTMKSLNLEHGSFLGYVPLNSTKIWELVGTSEGFVGCIHKVRVGRHLVEFSKGDSFISSMKEVFQCPVIAAPSPHHLTTTPMYPIYDSDEFFLELPDSVLSTTYTKGRASSDRPTFCSLRNPCHNYGHCWDDKGSPSGYRCVCHPQFTGKHCETRTSHTGESGFVLDFRRSTYLELPRIDSGARVLAIELWLMIRSTDGLILYNGQDNNNKGDFVAIFMSRGHLVFMFDLGSGVANLTWTEPLRLNKWHWVVASREGRDGKLEIDGVRVQLGRSPPSLSELNLELSLYFGGVSDKHTLRTEVSGLPAFDGVLQNLKINGRTYYHEFNNAVSSGTVHRYEGPPCGSSVSPPCANGGTCLPRLDSFVCLCKGEFSGRTCDAHHTAAGPVRFDGKMYLEYPGQATTHSALNTTEYEEPYHEYLDSQFDELFRRENGRLDSSSASSNDEDDDPDSHSHDSTFEADFVQRSTAQLRNRIDIVFRTSTTQSGVILWTGSNFRTKTAESSEPHWKGYMGLFIVEGYAELRVDLDATNKSGTQAAILRSKTKVNDNRWHHILIARRGQSAVLQVDGSVPARATVVSRSGVLVTDGRYWIGGVPDSVLPAGIPSSHHEGFVGCVDLVRIEKRRIPLGQMAHAAGIGYCEEESY